MSHRILVVPTMLLALAGWACAGGDAKDASLSAPVEVKGACADAFTAQVCTWARMDGTTLVEAGALVPLAVIEKAPAEVQMAWPPPTLLSIEMPEAARQQGDLTHMTMFWEAGGHPPGAFLTPHFDFHFYTISAADRMAIDCKDESKPATLPAAFGLPDIPLPPEMVHMTGVPVLTGLCVPNMGMHALLNSEIERKDAFSGTMVIGYYKGTPIFVEPMVSKAMLMNKASFDLPIPHVPGLTGRHPTMFRAVWDATQQAYRLTFSGFAAA